MRKILIIICLSSLTIPVCAQEIRKIKITDLEKTIATSRTPLIIDFWATFCQPCMEEIPYFLEFVKQHQKDSLQLILVSLDLKEAYPARIKAMAAKRKFAAPIRWLDESNADYFCPKVDSSWSGAIPASLFINNKTGYRKFFEAQLSKEKLEKEIMALLGKKD